MTSVRNRGRGVAGFPWRRRTAPLCRDFVARLNQPVSSIPVTVFVAVGHIGGVLAGRLISAFCHHLRTRSEHDVSDVALLLVSTVACTITAAGCNDRVSVRVPAAVLRAD